MPEKLTDAERSKQRRDIYQHILDNHGARTRFLAKTIAREMNVSPSAVGGALQHFRHNGMAKIVGREMLDCGKNFSNVWTIIEPSSACGSYRGYLARTSHASVQT